MEYTGIKYNTDRFYLRLDGFDLSSFKYFDNDTVFDCRLAAYIHEYYHYLTNVSSFPGMRQFVVSVPDYVRLITRLSWKGGIDAFPVKSNHISNCRVEVEYWEDVKELMEIENYNKNAHDYLNLRTYRVERPYLKQELMTCEVNGIRIEKPVTRCYVDIDAGMKPYTVYLSLYIIDEFLSSSIDRFFYEKSIVDTSGIIGKQDFYPYGLFDAICSSYGLYLSNRDKILIAYCALHSFNPGERLKAILEAISMDIQSYEAGPESFLSKFIGDYYSIVQGLINYKKSFIDECIDQNRRVLASLSTQLWSLSRKALSLLEGDYFYFVRPFMLDFESDQGKIQMLNLLDRIRKEMKEPLILQNNILLNPTNDLFKTQLAILMAIYEIIDSLYEHRIAQRLYRQKYSYPIESPDNDKLINLPTQAPFIETWHVALNELSLIALYKPGIIPE
jgi:hypothetical protein